jgi:hypothetical protein
LFLTGRIIFFSKITEIVWLLVFVWSEKKIETMVWFGPILILYYSLDICAQFELSKNLIGWLVFKWRVVFSPPVFLSERAIKGYRKNFGQFWKRSKMVVNDSCALNKVKNMWQVAPCSLINQNFSHLMAKLA